MPYFAYSSLFTSFLSLSNFDLVSSGGSLLEESARGRISEISRKPGILRCLGTLSPSRRCCWRCLLGRGWCSDVVTADGEEDEVCLRCCCFHFFFIVSSSLSHRKPPLCTNLEEPVLHIKVRLPILLCAVKTVEGDFRFCWTISPNVGQTHKENPNLVRIFYMIFNQFAESVQPLDVGITK